MRILNIQLTTPSAASLAYVAVLTMAAAGFGSLLDQVGLLASHYAELIPLGVCSEALAASYGISIQKHGWRGVVLTLAFAGAVSALAYLAALIA